MEYASLREAALMCRDAITFTPPFALGGGKGETKQAELIGKAAVARDLNTLFVAVNDKKRSAAAIHLSNMASAARMRRMSDFIIAQKAARDSGISFDSNIVNKIVRDADETRAYQKATNYFNTSQVSPNSKPVDNLEPIHQRFKYVNRRGKTRIVKYQGDYHGRFLVTSKSILNQYIKSQQQMVGKLKSGWWNTLMALPKPQKKGVDQNYGRKGVASYVKRFSGNAIVYANSTPTKVNILFGNAIGDNDNKASSNNVKGLMYSAAILRMQRDLQQFISRDISKFNDNQPF
jgi:hypothetical protein